MKKTATMKILEIWKMLKYTHTWQKVLLEKDTAFKEIELLCNATHEEVQEIKDPMINDYIEKIAEE